MYSNFGRIHWGMPLRFFPVTRLNRAGTLGPIQKAEYIKNAERLTVRPNKSKTIRPKMTIGQKILNVNDRFYES